MSAASGSQQPPPGGVRVPEVQRILPGPAGKLQQLAAAGALHQATPEVLGLKDNGSISTQFNRQLHDACFQSAIWSSARDYVAQEEARTGVAGQLHTVQMAKQVSVGKVPQMLVVLASFQPSGSGSAFSKIKDPSGSMGAALHSSALQQQPQLGPGSVLLLQQVSVFTPAPGTSYLAVTAANIARAWAAEPPDDRMHNAQHQPHQQAQRQQQQQATLRQQQQQPLRNTSQGASSQQQRQGPYSQAGPGPSMQQPTPNQGPRGWTQQQQGLQQQQQLTPGISGTNRPSCFPPASPDVSTLFRANTNNRQSQQQFGSIPQQQHRQQQHMQQPDPFMEQQGEFSPAVGPSSSRGGAGPPSSAGAVGGMGGGAGLAGGMSRQQHTPAWSGAGVAGAAGGNSMPPPPPRVMPQASIFSMPLQKQQQTQQQLQSQRQQQAQGQQQHLSSLLDDVARSAGSGGGGIGCGQYGGGGTGPAGSAGGCGGSAGGCGGAAPGGPAAANPQRASRAAADGASASTQTGRVGVQPGWQQQQQHQYGQQQQSQQQWQQHQQHSHHQQFSHGSQGLQRPGSQHQPHGMRSSNDSQPTQRQPSAGPGAPLAAAGVGGSGTAACDPEADEVDDVVAAIFGSQLPPPAVPRAAPPPCAPPGQPPAAASAGRGGYGSGAGSGFGAGARSQGGVWSQQQQQQQPPEWPPTAGQAAMGAAAGNSRAPNTTTAAAGADGPSQKRFKPSLGGVTGAVLPGGTGMQSNQHAVAAAGQQQRQQMKSQAAGAFNRFGGFQPPLARVQGSAAAGPAGGAGQARVGVSLLDDLLGGDMDLDELL